METVVGVLGGLAARALVLPQNAGAGTLELDHACRLVDPQAVVAPADAELPGPLARLPRIAVDLAARAPLPEDSADPERPALVLSTSGTTGLPKGVLLSRRAIAGNLDALADAWAATAEDRLTHALPLFHVHGLILGVLGPLRLGGSVHHTGRFSPEAIGAAFEAGATMLYAVPTMVHRLADAMEDDPGLAAAVSRARLLVSGSAGLPAIEHARVERLTGQRIAERYGMTETMITTAVRADDPRRAGTVGRPLPGVELRLLDDDGGVLDAHDPETIGEIAVRSAHAFSGYLRAPDATAAAFRDGWFLTGDLATRDATGALRIVGRRGTDIVKSGGFKVGAGEVEAALLEHPGVAEAAVLGLPDDDLGERIVAWVVLRPGRMVEAGELIAHTTTLLAAHKRPRELRFVDALPRNALGKVRKADLRG
jgi:malonyl-CoA/methylmalonyl-CoA synthetase